MRKLFNILLLIFLCGGIKGQTSIREIVGKVSFISSQDVYVRFSNTAGIARGDTLFISSGGNVTPAFIVKNLSTMSCVCQQISSDNISVDHLVIARAKVLSPKEEEKPAEKAVVAVSEEKSVNDTAKTILKNSGVKQNIRGSLSINSYSDFSNTIASNSQRFRYLLSLDARNIGNSKLSAETYISFGHKAGDWQAVQKDIFSALKIYSLALKYDFSKTSSLAVGRRTNPKISNIGPVDGVQYEQTVNRFTFGAVSGFRPDYTNFSFDSKLFQFGGFVSYNTKNESRYTETSLAIMEQMNGSKTDRRFIYLQHSNALAKNLYFFSTFEVDLYKLVNNKPTTTFDLTGLYLSLRYRVSGNLSISGSYDARKNVIYYETYKTYTDMLLESAMRQGYRLQINYRISSKLMAGVNGGYRFAKTDPKPSENVYGYLTYSQIGGTNFSATISGTYLKSSYMTGVIEGAGITHGFFTDKLFAELGYKYVNYNMPESSTKINQNVAELNISMPVAKKLFLSAYYEGTFEKSDKYSRIYLQVRIRF